MVDSPFKPVIDFDHSLGRLDILGFALAVSPWAAAPPLAMPRAMP